MSRATPSRSFDELTDPEIAAALARSPRVVLPMGSVEQHGPHLPTGTDFFAATAIALAVAEHIDALVLPLCPLGVTPMHMPYPGTVSLRPETLQAVVSDIGSSLAAHGCREFVLLNWHEGNIPSLALVAEHLHRDLGLSVVVVQACYVAEERFGPVAEQASPMAGRSRRGRCCAAARTWSTWTARRAAATAGRASWWISCAGTGPSSRC